jgi:hypothetical protein
MLDKRSVMEVQKSSWKIFRFWQNKIWRKFW